MSMDAGQSVVITRATIRAVTNDRGEELTKKEQDASAFSVQFNPEKLDITLTNTFKESKGKNPVQVVDDTTAQLSVELQFDTTDDGSDVRQKTGKIAEFLQPLDYRLKVQRGEKLPPPRVMEFDWGTVLFRGYIDSYTESLDFFSHEGVALRATVSLSLTQEERKFDPRQEVDSKDNNSDPSFDSKSADKKPDGGGTTEAPQPPGAPVDNAVAAANGLEDARQSTVDTLALPEAGGLGRGPAAFASAGASLGAGLSAGAGAGIGGGFGGGAGLGVGASAGIGAGAGLGVGGSAGIGGGLSAGAGFSAGASAGLGGSLGASASAGSSSGFNLSSSTSGFSTSSSNSSGGFSAVASASAGGSSASAFAGLSAKPPKLEIKPVSFSSSVSAKTPISGSASLGGSVSASAGVGLAAGVTASIEFDGGT